MLIWTNLDSNVFLMGAMSQCIRGENLIKDWKVLLEEIRELPFISETSLRMGQMLELITYKRLKQNLGQCDNMTYIQDPYFPGCYIVTNIYAVSVR